MTQRIIVTLWLIASICVYNAANAGPPNGVETAEGWWFRSLKQPNGGSCCAETADGKPDCHRLDDNMVRAVGNRWEFFATEREFGSQIGDNKWHTIPEAVLIRGRKLAELGGNPTGKFVVCAMYGYPSSGYGSNDTSADIMVLCAVPASGT